MRLRGLGALVSVSRLRTIFFIAIPIMVQNLVQNVQIVIDRIFLGHLDPSYLSSVGNVVVPYNAVSLFVLSAATGITIQVSQAVGAKKFVTARKTAESSFVYATLFSSLLFLLWFFGADVIFKLLGAEGQIEHDAASFVRILAGSLVVLGADASASAVLQGVGHTRPIMISGLIKTVLNVVLDWLLIFGHWGFPALGLEGAAWATLIANVVGAVVVVWASLRWKGMPFRCRKKEILRPSLQRFRKTLSIGLPTGLESLLWFLGQMVLQRFLNELNPMALAVTSVDASIRVFALVVYLGFARSAMTLVGQAVGGKRESEALQTGILCQLLSLGVSFVWALVMILDAGNLARLFTSDPALIATVTTILHLSAGFIVVQSLNVVIGGSIRATGDTRWMLYSQIAGTLFVLPVAGLLMFGWGWGISGMYVVMILDELLRGVVNVVRFILGRNPFAGRWREWRRRWDLVWKRENWVSGEGITAKSPRF
jgi:putative MATE family efflux protein